jgi:hypothetical protein
METFGLLSSVGVLALDQFSVPLMGVGYTFIEYSESFLGPRALLISQAISVWWGS